ncbi:hypothetical protein [Acidithiobacillus ferriphilus]|uniref:hypothetical protein n=1 Tax=Acidithiobacillus ferriphilus TaxID=1689834 RepID=UPI001C067999|nr:hypothetical protein [Acidithiobacillus ferriphilus]MBU2854821.1 hypothetical protein [Acidithiobacillus ferriphilus]
MTEQLYKLNVDYGSVDVVGTADYYEKKLKDHLNGITNSYAKDNNLDNPKYAKEIKKKEKEFSNVIPIEQNKDGVWVDSVYGVKQDENVQFFANKLMATKDLLVIGREYLEPTEAEPKLQRATVSIAYKDERYNLELEKEEQVYGSWQSEWCITKNAKNKEEYAKVMANLEKDGKYNSEEIGAMYIKQYLIIGIVNPYLEDNVAPELITQMENNLAKFEATHTLAKPSTEKEMTAKDAAQLLFNKGLIQVDTDSLGLVENGTQYINADIVEAERDLGFTDDLKVPAMGTGVNADFVLMVPSADIAVDIKVQDNPSQVLVYQWDVPDNVAYPNVYPATREANESGYDKLCGQIEQLCVDEGIQITDGDERDILCEIEAKYKGGAQFLAHGCLVNDNQTMALEPDKANDHHGIYKGQVLTGFSDTKVYTNKNIEFPINTVAHPRDAFDLDDDELAEKVGKNVDITYRDGQAKMVDTKEKTVGKEKGREV